MPRALLTSLAACLVPVSHAADAAHAPITSLPSKDSFALWIISGQMNNYNFTYAPLHTLPGAYLSLGEAFFMTICAVATEQGEAVLCSHRTTLLGEHLSSHASSYRIT